MTGVTLADRMSSPKVARSSLLRSASIMPAFWLMNGDSTRAWSGVASHPNQLPGVVEPIMT